MDLLSEQGIGSLWYASLALYVLLDTHTQGSFLSLNVNGKFTLVPNNKTQQKWELVDFIMLHQTSPGLQICISVVTRKLILPTAWVNLEADASLVELPDE